MLVWTRNTMWAISSFIDEDIHNVFITVTLKGGKNLTKYIKTRN